MGEVQLAIEAKPDPGDVAFVRSQLDAYNIGVTGFDDFRPLSIFARDEQQAVIGGLMGFTWGHCLKISILWLREEWRSHGYGTQLIRAAEAEGRARNCHHAVVETHSFQAPAFYEKLGYVTCGTVDEYPAGFRHYILQKTL